MAVTPYVVLDAGMLAGAAVGSRVALDDQSAHHLTRVLRRRPGSSLVATDGSGREVEATLQAGAVVVDAVRDVAAPTPRIEVAQAVGKGRKHDEVVRMLTEVGVDAITAVTTARTQVDLSGKADRVRDRWRAVADAACTQARRPHRPAVDGPMDLTDLLDAVGDAEVDTRLVVAHVGATGGPLGALADVAGGVARVVLLVGPEGGFTDDEVTQVVSAGGRLVSLGPTVLRTEHAGLVLAGITAAATGRMRPAPGSG